MSQAGPPEMNQTPGSMLEIYMHALQNKTGDDLLDAINMGVGNYSEEEYWQQVEAFRDGMFADAAMTKKVLERAKLQTKKRMVEAVFNDPEARMLRGVDYPEPVDTDPDNEERAMREYFDEHMEDVWENLGYTRSDGGEYTTEEHRAWLVGLCTGLDLDWTPPHWRMLKMRHEASRSKDAHLLDNLFGRPPEPDPRPMEDFQ